MVSSNLENLLGVIGSDIHSSGAHKELVVTEFGGLMDFESKVIGVISPGRGVVDMF